MSREDWQRCEHTIVSLAAELRKARMAGANPKPVKRPDETVGYDEIEWDDMSPREVVDAVIDLESKLHSGVLGENAAVLFMEGWQDLGGAERSQVRELLTVKISEYLGNSKHGDIMAEAMTAKRLNELIQISKPGAGGKG
jgi:hypothetical protein